MGRKESFQETADWKEHDYWKQMKKKMLVSDRCPRCGFVPIVKKRKMNGKEFWVYICKCSEAVIEARAWEKEIDAMAKYADVLWGNDGLVLPKSELEGADIVGIYETALEAMVE